MKNRSAYVVLLIACSAPLLAQWPKYATTGVPRDAKGLVQMEARTPRTANGKPDLSGNWVRGDRDPLPQELAGVVARGPGDSGAVVVEPRPAPFPPDPNAPPLATFFDLGANIPGGLPFTTSAADLKKARMATNNKDNPDANCLPMGITQFHMQPQPRKIVQTANLILIVYEANYGLRYIYTDGRKLPPQGDPLSWWYGYSVGHWEGDVLVVETNNLRGAETSANDGWLDVRGSPYSEQAHFTERFRRPTFGKLEIDVKVEDPKSYTKPFTVRINQRFVDEEPIEFVCNENQQFRQRIKVE
ncbi:MAG TPA: hypothetical protein VK210_09125 [Terriglobia bacterium]|nr:hypothetical protein [Terriglobia bacterium]